MKSQNNFLLQIIFIIILLIISNPNAFAQQLLTPEEKSKSKEQREARILKLEKIMSNSYKMGNYDYEKKEKIYEEYLRLKNHDYLLQLEELKNKIPQCKTLEELGPFPFKVWWEKGDGKCHEFEPSNLSYKYINYGLGRYYNHFNDANVPLYKNKEYEIIAYNKDGFQYYDPDRKNNYWVEIHNNDKCNVLFAWGDKYQELKYKDRKKTPKTKAVGNIYFGDPYSKKYGNELKLGPVSFTLGRFHNFFGELIGIDMERSLYSNIDEINELKGYDDTKSHYENSLNVITLIMDENLPDAQKEIICPCSEKDIGDISNKFFFDEKRLTMQWKNKEKIIRLFIFWNYEFKKYWVNIRMFNIELLKEQQKRIENIWTKEAEETDFFKLENQSGKDYVTVGGEEWKVEKVFVDENPVKVIAPKTIGSARFMLSTKYGKPIKEKLYTAKEMQTKLLGFKHGKMFVTNYEWQAGDKKIILGRFYNKKTYCGNPVIIIGEGDLATNYNKLIKEVAEGKGKKSIKVDF